MKFALPLLRTPAGSSQDVVIAIADHFTRGTHWLGNKKYLCAGDGCPGCVIDEPRSAVYVVVFSPAGGKHFLLEITERSWLSIKFLVGGRMQANLKVGDVLALHRKKKTSPLRIEVVDHKPEKCTHPELTTLRSVAALYRLALPGAYETPGEFFERESQKLKFRLLAEIKNLENGARSA